MVPWVVRPAARGQRPVDLKAAVARHGRGLQVTPHVLMAGASRTRTIRVAGQDRAGRVPRPWSGLRSRCGRYVLPACAGPGCAAGTSPGRRIAGPEESRPGPLRTAPLPDPAAASLPVSLRHRAAFGDFGGPAAPFAMRRCVPPAGPAAGSR